MVYIVGERIFYVSNTDEAEVHLSITDENKCAGVVTMMVFVVCYKYGFMNSNTIQVNDSNLLFNQNLPVRNDVLFSLKRIRIQRVVRMAYNSYSRLSTVNNYQLYSPTCLKQPDKRLIKMVFEGRLLLNTGQLTSKKGMDIWEHKILTSKRKLLLNTGDR